MNIIEDTFTLVTMIVNFKFVYHGVYLVYVAHISGHSYYFTPVRCSAARDLRILG